MHHVDRDTPWDEIWQAMDVLVAQGKVLYVGSSNFAGWHIVQANEAAARRHSLGLVSEQSLYNLDGADHRARGAPRVRALRRRDDPVEPARRRAARRRARRPRRRRSPGQRGRAVAGRGACARSSSAWEKLCAELGHAPADVALAWLLHQPVVTAPIIGPRTLEQLDTAHAVRSTCSSTPTSLAQLDEIFPGPGGPAPEAYAW